MRRARHVVMLERCGDDNVPKGTYNAKAAAEFGQVQ
jgi:hypothetical protein